MLGIRCTMGRRGHAPTPRQHQVLAALKAKMKTGHPPANVREIADALGLEVTTGILDDLKALKRLRLVRYVRGGLWNWWPTRRAAKRGA